MEGAGKCLWLVQKTEWITFSVAGYREVIISLEIWMWCMLWYGFFCRIIGWLRANRVGMVIYMHTYFFSLVLGRDLIFFLYSINGDGVEGVGPLPSLYLPLPPSPLPPPILHLFELPLQMDLSQILAIFPFLRFFLPPNSYTRRRKNP